MRIIKIAWSDKNQALWSSAAVILSAFILFASVPSQACKYEIRSGLASTNSIIPFGSMYYARIQRGDNVCDCVQEGRSRLSTGAQYFVLKCFAGCGREYFWYREGKVQEAFLETKGAGGSIEGLSGGGKIHCEKMKKEDREKTIH